MSNGWIKLHRKILDNPMASKPQWSWVWVTLLLLANHDGTDSFIFNGVRIFLKAGQVLTGRKKLALQTGVPESTIEDILRYLESESQIRQQKNTKYRVITILKWESYQTFDNKATTKRQPADTFKKLRSKEDTIQATQSVADDVEIVLEPSEKKRQKKKKRYDVLGAEIIKALEVVDPKNKTYYNNHTQRAACDFLIIEYGLEEVLKRIQVLPKTNKLNYFPNITTPVQLREKWVNLQDAVDRRRNQSKIKNPIAFT